MRHPGSGRANVSKRVYKPGDTVAVKTDYTVTTLNYQDKGKRPDAIIVGFKGISETECPELATPPMFFIVTLDKDSPKLVSNDPVLAGDLFEAGHFNENISVRIIDYY